MKIINNWFVYTKLIICVLGCQNLTKDKLVLNSNSEIAYQAYLNPNTKIDEGIVWVNIKLLNTQNMNHSTLTYNKNLEQYTLALDYYLNRAMDDLAFEYCDSIYKPIGYVFENNYNLVGYDMIVVGFEIRNIEKNCENMEGKVIFNDRNYNNQIQKMLIKINSL